MSWEVYRAVAKDVEHVRRLLQKSQGGPGRLDLSEGGRRWRATMYPSLDELNRTMWRIRTELKKEAR